MNPYACPMCRMPDTSAYHLIPELIMKALVAYVQDRRPTGGFLQAVLENNLKEAIARADDNSMRTLPAIVGWVYNKAPALAWGSPEKVADWLMQCDQASDTGPEDVA